MTDLDERHRHAQQNLFIALNELEYGSNKMDVVEAIDELVLAAISVAFAKHPATKDAFKETPSSAGDANG
jgi:hypothetical protein